MSTEVSISYAWMYGVLTGDATLQGYTPGGVQYDFPLPGIAAPYSVIKFQDGTDHVVFGGGRAYADMRFRAVVAGPVSAISTLLSASARLDVLLTAVQVVVTGGTIMASFQEQPLSEDVWVDSEKWRIEGGIYRIMAKAN